ISTDGPVNANGIFQRTTRTIFVQRTPSPAATRASSAQPGPWVRKPDDLTPHWSARNVTALYSSKPLGPVYDPTGVKVRVFAPNAKRVELVLDDSGARIPAAPDRTGVWEAATGKRPDSIYGQR